MADENLFGKTALITGAAKRLGRAIALKLAEEGVNIVVHYNQSVEEATELIKEFKGMGVGAWDIPADFANPDEYRTLVERSLKAAGSVDFLINNASIFPASDFKDFELYDFTEIMEINTWAPFLISREMKRLLPGGKIVNILDTRITGFDSYHASYTLSKKILAELTRWTALEYAPQFQVNAIAPGLILPPAGRDESYLNLLKDGVPLRRHGDEDDFTSAVLFLLRNSYITGQIIYVDGGNHLKESRLG